MPGRPSLSRSMGTHTWGHAISTEVRRLRGRIPAARRGRASTAGRPCARDRLRESRTLLTTGRHPGAGAASSPRKRASGVVHPWATEGKAVLQADEDGDPQEKSMGLSPDILTAIGNTPLIQLRRVVAAGSARIVVKLEGANPTGSMKDRMARSMIDAAEADGRLPPGRPVVEFTGGSTGTSLAMVCAIRGHPLTLVTSNAASLEKRNHMKALGASLTLLHSEGGKMTRDLYQALLRATEQIVLETGAFWTDQFHNPDQVAGYHSMALEMWEQADRRVDAFVHVVGTCGSLRGASTALRQLNPRLQVVAVEPAESPVLSGGPPGPHRIEGAGLGLIPFFWDPALADSIEMVSTSEAEEMARRLAREEGIFSGVSSGANVVAAVRVAERLGPEAVVATIMVDHGLKYLSTDAYQKGQW